MRGVALVALAGIGAALALSLGALALYRRYRRTEIAGFDMDEAASFVWSNLDRRAKGRVPMTTVVDVLDWMAQLADEGGQPPDLVGYLAERAEGAGVRISAEDLEMLVGLQFRYAEEKGLL